VTPIVLSRKYSGLALTPFPSTQNSSLSPFVLFQKNWGFS
jgi:hypothetical protein